MKHPPDSFKHRAHALVQGLPANATWRDLINHAIDHMELENEAEALYAASLTALNHDASHSERRTEPAHNQARPTEGNRTTLSTPRHTTRTRINPPRKIDLPIQLPNHVLWFRDLIPSTDGILVLGWRFDDAIAHDPWSTRFNHFKLGVPSAINAACELAVHTLKPLRWILANHPTPAITSESITARLTARAAFNLDTPSIQKPATPYPLTTSPCLQVADPTRVSNPAYVSDSASPPIAIVAAINAEDTRLKSDAPVAILARHLAKHLHLRDCTHLLHKRPHQPLHSIRYRQIRAAEITGTYTCIAPLNCSLLIICDDCITTGSTFKEIARAVRVTNPTAQILGFALARNERLSYAIANGVNLTNDHIPMSWTTLWNVHTRARA